MVLSIYPWKIKNRTEISLKEKVFKTPIRNAEKYYLLKKYLIFITYYTPNVNN